MTAEEFLERAGPLLLAEEARHNLMLGVAGNVRDSNDPAGPALVFTPDEWQVFISSVRLA